MKEARTRIMYVHIQGRQCHVRIHTLRDVSAQDSCRMNQRRVGQENFNSKDSIEGEAIVHVP
jgi:hypothetical protein